MSYAVKLQNVVKRYSMSNSKKDMLMSIFSNYVSQEEFYALDDVSIEIEKGEIVGLVGVNGSGKSSILKIISGISTPTSGTVDINGEVALLGVGSGMDVNLTGIENIEQKAILLGFSDHEIKNMIQDIIDFSELGEFVYKPVRTYSSGMRARLGFSISINIDPDILIIDEALAVGDAAFVDKCMSKMNEFKERGKTIFFVAHSAGQIRSFCKKAIWMEFGKIREYGDAQIVTRNYEQFLNEYKSMSQQERIKFNSRKKIVVTNSMTSKNDICLKNKVTGALKYVNKGYSFATLFLLFFPSVLRKHYQPFIHYIIYFFISRFILKGYYLLGIDILFLILYPLIVNKLYIKYLIKKKNYIIENR
jgi:teichoic acid transport system ATP-binding protein